MPRESEIDTMVTHWTKSIVGAAILHLALGAVGVPAMAQDAGEPEAADDPAGVGPESSEVRSAIEAATPDENAIRTALEFEGYSNVRDLETEDGHYLAKADRFGETVEVKIDATTRLILEPKELSEAQIRNKLEQEGYSNVRGLDRSGDVGALDAEAEKNGEPVSLRIDPATGNVMLESRPES